MILISFLFTFSFSSHLLLQKLSEKAVRLESRHLAAVKIQPWGNTYVLGPAEIRQLWKEIDILRGVVHENIIDYYEHFAMYDRDRLVVYILMEYANAGDMEKEVNRYPEKRIDEPGARYYALQIASGLKYLHSKFITHCDLHWANVLLKYNPDGSKTCMICDFGISVIDPDPDELAKWQQSLDVKDDIHLFSYLIELTVRGREPSPDLKLSREVMAIIDFAETWNGPVPGVSDNVDRFIRHFTWFKGKVKAPIPKPPSPLLDRKTIDSMGYLPPKEKGGWRTKESSSAQPQPVIPTVAVPPSRPTYRKIISSPQLEWNRSPPDDRQPTTSRAPQRQSSPIVPPPGQPSTSRVRADSIKAAAQAAVASGLEDSRVERVGVGARIRRSVSSLRQSVARGLGHCFHRDRSQQPYERQ